MKRGFIDLLWHHFKEAPLMLEFDPKKSSSFKIACHHKTSFDLNDRLKSLASHLVEKKSIIVCFMITYLQTYLLQITDFCVMKPTPRPLHPDMSTNLVSF